MQALKTMLKTSLVLAVVAAGPANADCVVPLPPDKIPDGSIATLDEMKNAQKAMRAYNDLIKAYTDCLHLETANAIATSKDGKVTDDERKLLDAAESNKNNQAVDQATAVTGRFNEQVRIYKSRVDQKKG